VEAPAWAAPLYIPEVTVPTPILSWAAQYPDFARALQMATALQRPLFWPVFTPDVTNPLVALAWTPEYPDFARVYLRVPHLDGGGPLQREIIVPTAIPPPPPR
jgi:hypothetical protein